MDAFESLVSEILWRDGYWVQTSVKVELTKKEKVEIGRPSSPRWEIDIVGFNGRRNELLVIECKSYLDSPGVSHKAFDGSDPRKATRFKLFNDKNLRRVVLRRLRLQMFDAGLVPKDPNIRLGLVCGKIATERDRPLLQEQFDRNGWLLWDDRWLRGKLSEMSKGGYENSPVAVVAKLLLRQQR